MTKLKNMIDYCIKYKNEYFKHTFFGYVTAVFMPIAVVIISLFFVMLFIIIKNLYMGNPVSDYVLIFIFDLIIICALYIPVSEVVKFHYF